MFVRRGHGPVWLIESIIWEGSVWLCLSEIQEPKAVVLKLGVAALQSVTNFWKKVTKICLEEYYTIQNDQPCKKVTT